MQKAISRLFPLYAVVFLASIGYSSMITIFTPMMMRERWGMVSEATPMTVRMTQLGILLALYPFGQFIGSPLIVALGRRYDKKRLLLISLCITAIAYGFLALSLENLSLGAVMASTFLAGLSEANESIAEDTIAELAAKEHHKKLMSTLHVSSSGAFLFGPILSGILAFQGLSIPFWGIFALIMIGFLFVLFLGPLPSQKLPVSAWKLVRDQFSAFSFERFHFAFGVNFLIYFAIFGFFRAYPMHLVESFDMYIYELSHYIAWVAVPIVFLNLFVTARLLKTFHSSTLLTWGSFGIGVFIYFLLFAAKGPNLWISLFLVAACIGICLPTSPVYIARSAHQSILSEILESDLAVLKGAEAIASLAGGALAAFFVPLPLYFFGAISILAALLLFFKK
ncbi:MAG: MFS transporter [Parachlamydiales bacterium]|nr:MFS transporter [Parachlamydiales bacterium]